MCDRKRTIPKKCKFPERFFFDHRGAKRKAHFAPQSCKKKAPEKKNFAAPPKRQVKTCLHVLYLQCVRDTKRNFPKGHIKLWISQKK